MGFQVRWFDQTHRRAESLQLDVASAAEVAAIAAERNAVVLDVRPITGRTGRHRAPNVALFCTELSTLLGAGLNVVEAVDALAKRRDGTERAIGLTEVYRRLLEALRDGRSFSQAIDTMADVFPPVFRAAVQATDLTASIREGLDRYVAFDRAVTELRSKLVSSLIYPAVVVNFGVLVVLFLLGYVVPRFASVYTELPTEASVATRWVLGAGHFIAAYRIELAAVAASCLVGALWAWRQGVLQNAALRLVAAVPALQRVWRDYELARFYRSFGLLLAGGFTVVRALEESRRGLGSAADQDALGESIDRVRSGELLSKSLYTAGLADDVEIRLLGAGERSATLATIAQTIGEVRQRRFSTSVERLSRVAEPLLLMVVGTTIGLIVLLMYLPIIDLATSVR